jgi:hypothetical protein
MSNQVYFIVEDVLQQSVLTKIVDMYKPAWEYKTVIGLKGNGYIKKNLKSFNSLAESIPTIVLTDLDNVACASGLITNWFNFKISTKLIFRIAVKEIETWLIGDRHNFSSFFGVPVTKIPNEVEEITNPKSFLIELAKKSRKKEIRENIPPTGTAVFGPGYNLILQEFIMNHWDCEKARMLSLSLNKTILRIKQHNYF